MWQAISNLLRDLHTEAAEIELRNELPGGEIHAPAFTLWRARLLVKCDESRAVTHLTAEADQA